MSARPVAPPPAHSATTRAFVQWIRSAAPYIHAFRGKTFVIAFGGEVVADDTFLGIIHDLNLLHSLGVHIVVIHGSRPQIEAILAQQHIRSRYAYGLRVTDAETMDCVLEAGGQVRSRIEALLSLGIANSPMAGARIRVSSGNFITAKPMGVREGIDMLLTGEVRRVDVDAIQQRLDDGDIVLISPLGYSPTGEIFNLALEEVATQVAVRVCAHKVIFLMETQGVKSGRRQLITEMSTKDAEAVLTGNGNRLPADVQLRRIPAQFSPQWIGTAKVWYTLEGLNEEKLVPAVFTAIHSQNIRLDQDKAFLDWIATQGVDRKKAEDMYNSFAVNGKVARAKTLVQTYGVQSVPTFVVDGKYTTETGQSKRHEDVPGILDKLIDKSRAEHK